MSVREKLAELGLSLPQAAAPVAAYAELPLDAPVEIEIIVELKEKITFIQEIAHE